MSMFRNIISQSLVGSVGPPNNEIWYTSSDGNIIENIYQNDCVVGGRIISNIIDGEIGKLQFNTDVSELSFGNMINYGILSSDTNYVTNIYLPSNLTVFPEGLLMYSGILSYTFRNTITSIGVNALNECVNLTSVTIPNSVESIGDNAFYDCTGLTSITIPNSVTSIGKNAFYGSSSLATMTVEDTTPPTLGTDAISTATTIIYVPAQSVNAYKSADKWSEYADIIQPIP